jgi:peroxiredoxin
MVLTPSTMLPLGTVAPDFALRDTVTTRTVRRDDFVDRRALVVIFLCNHCPYVKHIREGLAKLGADYADRGAAIVAISSNDAFVHPDDAPARLAEEARLAGYRFPVLHDETQDIAKAYRAACTPDFYVFDGARRLVYRGQFDDSRPGNDRPVTGRDLRAALDAVLAGGSPAVDQRPSIGCNIKWKPGREPDYFKSPA